MNSRVDSMNFRNPGLDSKECLKILYDQIDQLLNDYRKRKFRWVLLVRNFFRKNKLEFFHNFFAVFICSLSLFFSFDERFTIITLSIRFISIKISTFFKVYDNKFYKILIGIKLDFDDSKLKNL